MTPRLRYIALLVAFVLPLSSLLADEKAVVKCSVNQERVWVYDSPTTFNVAAKLKCGETVALLARENGFVKVRTANGTEGYVTEENLPKAGSLAPAAETNVAGQPTLASAARAATAARAGSSRPNGQPVASSAAAPIAQSNASSLSPPRSASAPATATVAPSASSSRSAPNSVAAAATAAAIPTSVHPATANSSSSRAKTKTTKSSAAASTPGKPATAPPAPAAPHSTGASVAHAALTPSTPAGPPSPAPSAVTGGDIYVGAASSAAAPANPAAVRNVADASSDEEGDDDSYLIRPKSESEDPACRFYFSGYGLSPGQFKWIVDNRQKKFPAVCPAASPAMVDYVIIFTHDVEFFNYTMPTPVHTEAGGFSDWNPIVRYDVMTVPRAEIDKSKREYVWVFHVKRGTYDPARFSPHRRFQFTKIESRYSRTVEDAFDYIEAQGVNR
jgi:Bacterial SH3 domain